MLKSTKVFALGAALGLAGGLGSVGGAAALAGTDVVKAAGITGVSGVAAVPVGTPDFKKLAAALDAGSCIDCHNADGVASDTRLVFPAYDASADRTREFGEGLLELIDTDKPAESRLLRKPTLLMKHAGGERIQPGTVDDAALKAWVLALATHPEPQGATQVLQWVRRPRAEKGGRVLRRLTARQYDNTIRDLLGDLTGVGRTFPPEDFVDGFQNQHMGQSAAPALIETYSNAAQLLANNAVVAIKNGDPNHLLPCGLAAANSDCRDTFIRTFGRRAFRRPLRDAETQRFKRIFSGPGDFAEGVRVTLETFLQSPSFLYLLDSDDPKTAPFARASRLSYLLWNTMPDEALLAQAEHGDLSRPEDVEKLARQMLLRPEAVAAVDEFVGQWLRLDGILNAYKDRRLFRQFNADVARAMAEETRRLVRDLVWNDRDFMTLFTARYTFATPEVAQIYGLPAAADGSGDRVAYPDSSERTGVLGHGAFLAATSKPSETSPTARGLFIREHFLCQTPPPPPPSVNMDLPVLKGDRPLTNRERMAAHLNDPSCAGCHRLTDGIGLGFEHFDAVGGYQEKMKVRVNAPFAADVPPEKRPEPKVFELDLDTTGTILGIANSDFTSPRQVGAILAGNDQCQLCIAKQLFRYAVGRKETSADEKLLHNIFEDFKKSGFKFKALLVSVARWTEIGLEGKRNG